jgi:hypothetical protein
MPDYQYPTQDELLNLAQQRDQLTDEARVELDSEISKRGIGTAEMVSYARELLARQKAVEPRAKRSKNFYETSNKRFIGKRNRKPDPRSRVEEFDTTSWFVFWIPAFPIGSYRIRRRFRRWWNPCPPRRVHILKTRLRDWEQILLTWVKAAAALLVLGLVLLAALNFHW